MKLQKPWSQRSKPRTTAPSGSDELDDPGEGVFGLFYSRQPEVAERETRSMILLTLAKLKPSTAKGAYIKSISISSTMSPSVLVDTRTVQVA